ncbi:hypothetical protein ACFW79_002388 [Salmonella enterica]
MPSNALSVSLPLQVLRSGAGYYIGTQNEEGPVSRESVEYFSTQSQAEHALKQGTWSQREQA